MRAEVIAIGTELLLGQIVDTNSAWIGEQLALAGIDCLRQTKVGDNEQRIVDAITESLGRAGAVICCGGLGPTRDDVTRQAIATVLGERLELDEDKADEIRDMFASRGRPMPPNNLGQAMRPPSARFIEQQPGTAPGLVAPLQGPDGREQVVYAVPGVPWEMQEMVSGTILGDLRSRAGEAGAIASRTLRTWGQSESGLDEMLAGRMAALDRTGDATIAFLASGIEGLKVRITAKGATADEAGRQVVLEETRVRAVLGDIVFGVDDETMEAAVLDLLRAADLTIAVAESLTGGLIASRLVDVAGASDVFRGGVVAYDPAVKFSLLGVPEGPVVNTATAEAMASGVRALLGADVGLGVTGVAGPARSEGRPAGTVAMAVDLNGVVSSTELRLPGHRRQVRELSCISVLEMLRRRLLD
ncbi:MAG: competence/damage-inducible protein A [Microthrixaceae bacterium]